MHTKDIEKLITDILKPILAEIGLFLVDVEYVREKNWYLRIFIDKLGGVEIYDCQMVSEKLSRILDEKDLIKEKYFLEVSSPGIDRPLKKEEDLEAAHGSRIDITFYAPWENTKTLMGVLVNHDSNFLEIRKLIKGKEFKNSEKIDRKLIANIRLHIDF